MAREILFGYALYLMFVQPKTLAMLLKHKSPLLPHELIVIAENLAKLD